MHRYFLILGLATLLCLVGCASLSTEPRLAGTYSGANSETLVFLSDASVFHTQLMNEKEERFFLVYFVSRRSNPGFLFFVGPDTSVFVGTSFLVSDEFSTVTAKWNDRRGPTNSWQVAYCRSSNVN
jgi:hypothetical protein